jgi:cytochrome c-type biogenesis protein CcmF
MLLIIFTYSLVIFGTFLTRSGVLSSVHAFAQSAIGPMFFAFIGITFITSTALLIYRWKDLKAEMEMTSVFSREAFFLLNNLLFMGVLVVCLWGVLFPLISELFTGQKVTVGPPFYERSVGPLLGALMALMGLAPLSAWGRSTIRTLGRAVWKPAIPALLVPVALVIAGMRSWVALVGFTLVAFVICITLFEYGRGVLARMKAQDENLFTALSNLTSRNRRRYGGYIIHIAMVIMAIGILGIEVHQVETQRSMAVGDEVELGGYTLRYDSLAQFPYTDGRMVTRAEMSVYRDGAYVATIAPRYDFYPDGQPMTIAGVHSTLAGDLYVVLVNWEDVSAAQAPFKIYYNPLINWLWIGSLVFILGYAVAAWPQKED